MAESRTTPAQKENIKQISKGWKLGGLDDTVEAVLASATKLEKEIGAETKYWEQIGVLGDKGWGVCRLPQEKWTLGVMFGFSEGLCCLSSAAFRCNLLTYSQQRRRSKTGVLLLFVETRTALSSLTKESLNRHLNDYEFASRPKGSSLGNLFRRRLSLTALLLKIWFCVLVTQYSRTSYGKN